MPADGGPLRCGKCGHHDFYVLSTGVTFKNGTICETYRWPGTKTSTDEGELDFEDLGYQVEQAVTQDPEVASVEGPIKALCCACLHDVTDLYLELGRSESTLPV